MWFWKLQTIRQWRVAKPSASDDMLQQKPQRWQAVARTIIWGYTASPSYQHLADWSKLYHWDFIYSLTGNPLLLTIEDVGVRHNIYVYTYIYTYIYIHIYVYIYIYIHIYTYIYIYIYIYVHIYTYLSIFNYLPLKAFKQLSWLLKVLTLETQATVCSIGIQN